jgi:O-methyltransferase involved in polyketide biosynthesis
MSEIDLSGQLARLTRRVQRAIRKLSDDQPLKRWFEIELEVLKTGGNQACEMEETSAYVRAMRQLDYMVMDQLTEERQESRGEESLYTQMARVPGALLHTVKQTNFSIEPELLLQDAQAVDLFELVSPTAKVVSHLRDRIGNLGFAHQLTCPRAAEQILNELGIQDLQVQQKMSTLFLARYLTINRVIAESGTKQVLELASGISPRGLQWSRENPGSVYIESDLPTLMRTKAKAIRDAIQQDEVVKRGVLHCSGVDALSLASLEHALEYTDPQASLVVVTEGLLLYFNREEMEAFLSNMRRLLTKRPKASWVVDFVAQQHLQELFHYDAEVASAVRKIFNSTSREVVHANPFVDEASIHDGLQAHGLKVESQTGLKEWVDSAPERFSSAGGDPGEICGTRKIWKIKAA